MQLADKGGHNVNQQPQYARPKEVCQHLKIGRSTLWHWIKTQKGFPRPVKAGQRVTLLDINAINEWLEGRTMQPEA